MDSRERYIKMTRALVLRIFLKAVWRIRIGRWGLFRARGELSKSHQRAMESPCLAIPLHYVLPDYSEDLEAKKYELSGEYSFGTARSLLRSDSKELLNVISKLRFMSSIGTRIFCSVLVNGRGMLKCRRMSWGNEKNTPSRLFLATDASRGTDSVRKTKWRVSEG